MNRPLATTERMLKRLMSFHGSERDHAACRHDAKIAHEQAKVIDCLVDALLWEKSRSNHRNYQNTDEALRKAKPYLDAFMKDGIVRVQLCKEGAILDEKD